MLTYPVFCKDRFLPMAFSMSIFSRFAATTFVALAGLHSSSAAQAALVFSFGRGGEPGIEDFFVEPGSELKVDVFIVETTGNRLQEEGVGSARFRLELSGQDVIHAPPESFDMASGFRRIDNDAGTDLVRIVDISGEATGLTTVQPIHANVGDNAVLLGTAILVIDSSFEGAVTLTARQQGQLDVSLGPSVLSSASVGSGTATVTAVPEPASAMVLAMAAVVGLWHRRARAISHPERSPGMASAAVLGSV